MEEIGGPSPGKKKRNLEGLSLGKCFQRGNHQEKKKISDFFPRPPRLLMLDPLRTVD